MWGLGRGGSGKGHWEGIWTSPSQGPHCRHTWPGSPFSQKHSHPGSPAGGVSPAELEIQHCPQAITRMALCPGLQDPNTPLGSGGQACPGPHSDDQQPPWDRHVRSGAAYTMSTLQCAQQLRHWGSALCASPLRARGRSGRGRRPSSPICARAWEPMTRGQVEATFCLPCTGVLRGCTALDNVSETLRELPVTLGTAGRPFKNIH